MKPEASPTITSPPSLRTPIRYLPGSSVRKLLPGIDRQLELIEAAYRATDDPKSDTPGTPEIVPRPGAVAHAMPAYVAEGDITSVKWLCDFPMNREQHGLPYGSGLIIVNDSATGLPLAVMDSTAITAARTAAASAACVAALAPGGWSTVGVIGYGTQARAHIEALSSLNPSATFQVFSRRGLESDGALSAAEDPRAAIDGADVVVTGMPLSVKLDPQVALDWLKPTALVLPIDDDSSLDAEVPNRAAAFYVDALDDFGLRRAHGKFAGWREPDGSVPEAVLERRSAEGVVVCANQGMGVLDAVFARAVLDAAERDGAGVLLER